MDEDDEYEEKIIGEIKCISHVEIKEEIIFPDNSSDSESTLSDNERTSSEGCLICNKYRAMFILLKNHDCELLDSTDECKLCKEITHWSNCFSVHKDTHKEDQSSDSTTSDYEDNEENCQICVKYEYMLPILKNHVCKEYENKCQDCIEFLNWTVCYKNHSDTHKDDIKKVKEEEHSSDSTTSDGEEIQKFSCDRKNLKECNICLNYEIMLIVMQENHICKMEKTGGRCEKCNEIIEWYKCFEKHKLTHENSDSLEIHSCRSDTIQNFDCGVCLKLNMILTKLVKNHTCKDKKSCEVCEEVSYWVSCFKKHKESDKKCDCSNISDGEDIEDVNTKNQYDCTFCTKFRAAILNLKHHICQKQRSGCQYCRETIFWTKNLKAHESIHSKHITPLKNYLSCSNCGKRFSGEKMLNVHMSYCKNSNLTCDICEKKFLNVFSLKKHKIFQSCRCGGVNSQQVCRICNKSFENSGELKKHEVIHHNSKLFKCKEEKSESSFKKFKKIHSWWSVYEYNPFHDYDC